MKLSIGYLGIAFALIGAAFAISAAVFLIASPAPSEHQVVKAPAELVPSRCVTYRCEK